MTTVITIVAIYFAIPVTGILISGRKLSLKGWIVFLLIWPIGWLFMGPEELP